MKNIWIMTWYTLREAFARKVFIFFSGISVLVLLGMILFFSLIKIDEVTAMFNSQGQNIDIKMIVTSIEIAFISPLSALGLLLAIFASSSFVPIMLEKGNIDLLISKPISRSQLLWGKYLGGLLVVLLNIAFLIFGVWIIISLKFSYWDPSLLWVILTITFTFAVLYSLIVLFGVITKNSIFGMMAAYFIFIILSPLLFALKDKLNTFFQSDFVKFLFDALYYIIPKTQELMGTLTFNIASGKGIHDFQPIISSFLFLILTMALSLILFERKDF